MRTEKEIVGRFILRRKSELGQKRLLEKNPKNKQVKFAMNYYKRLGDELQWVLHDKEAE